MFNMFFYERAQAYCTALSLCFFTAGSRKLWPDISLHPNHKDRVGGDRGRRGTTQPTCAFTASTAAMKEKFREKEAPEVKGEKAKIVHSLGRSVFQPCSDSCRNPKATSRDPRPGTQYKAFPKRYLSWSSLASVPRQSLGKGFLSSKNVGLKCYKHRSKYHLIKGIA